MGNHQPETALLTPAIPPPVPSVLGQPTAGSAPYKGLPVWGDRLLAAQLSLPPGPWPAQRVSSQDSADAACCVHGFNVPLLRHVCPTETLFRQTAASGQADGTRNTWDRGTTNNVERSEITDSSAVPLSYTGTGGP